MLRGRCHILTALCFLAISSAACSDLLGSDEDQELTDYRNPASFEIPPTPACEGVVISTSQASPFERVDVNFEFQDYAPDGFGVELRLESGEDGFFFLPIFRDDQGFFFSAPPHPAGIDGGVLHLLFTDGQVTCDGEFSFIIDPLAPAPGALQDLIDHSAGLAQAVADSFGYSQDELVAADMTSLPAPLVPLAIQLWSLNHRDNPNSLQAALDGDRLPLDYAPADLEFAEAILAASGHLDNLRSRREAVDELVHTNQAIEIAFQSSPNLLQGPAKQTHQGLCSLFDDRATVKIRNDKELSYYMRKARRAQAHGERVERVAFAVGVLGIIPGPSAVAAAILSFGLAIDQLLTNAHAALYPRELTAPEVDNLQFDFNEDFITRGNWGPYRVTATSPGWNAPADILDAMVSIIFASASLLNKGVKLPKAVGAHLEQFLARFADDALAAMGPETLNNLTNFLIENAASLGADFLLDDQQGCVIHPGPWPDIEIQHLHWLHIAYSGGIAGLLGTHASTFCRDAPPPTSRSEYEPIATGPGRVSIRASQDHFPTTNHPYESRIHNDVMTHEIKVHATPSRLVGFPGETIEVSGIIENAHNQQGRWHYPDSVTILQSHTPSSGRQTLELRLPESADDFPVFIVLSSRSQTGLRQPLCEPSARTALISIQNETDLEITPRHRCIFVGGSLQLEADLAHPDQTATVQWAASAGTIDPTGYFQAPSSSQAVTITATADGTELEDRVEIRVGECGCFFDARVSGGGLDLHLSNYGGMFAYQHDGSLSIQMADQDRRLGAVLQGYLTTNDFTASITDTPEYGLAGAIITRGDVNIYRHDDRSVVQGSFEGKGAHFGEFFEFLHLGEDLDDAHEYRMKIHFMVPVATGLNALLPNDDCSPP